jgi:hypothetical protein
MLIKELSTTASLHSETASHDDHEQRNRLTDPHVTPVSSSAPILSDSKSSPKRRSLLACIYEFTLSMLRKYRDEVELFVSLTMVFIGSVVVFVVTGTLALEVFGSNTVRQDLSGSLGAQIATNFPDPSILYDNGMWYAYATNQGANVVGEGVAVHYGKHFVQPSRANIQGVYSSDFKKWDPVPISQQPLKDNGRWAQPATSDSANTWAPSVIRRDDGKFVLY